MNFSISSILAGLIFGAFGVYFIRLGKREGNLRRASLGLFLITFPYFVSNDFLLWGLGISAMALGFKSN